MRKDRTPGLFFHSLLPGIELRGIVQIFLVALQDLVLLGFHEGNNKKLPRVQHREILAMATSQIVI